MTTHHYALDIECDICGRTKELERNSQITDWMTGLRISTDGGYSHGVADLCLTCANLPLLSVMERLTKRDHE